MRWLEVNLISDVLICSFITQNGNNFHIPMLSHKHKRCNIVYLLRISRCVYVWLHVCIVVSYLISIYVNQDTRLDESVVHHYMHVDFQSARVHTQSWQLRLILGSFFCRIDSAVSRSQFLTAANNSHWKFEENYCEISHSYPTPHMPPYDYHAFTVLQWNLQN